MYRTLTLIRHAKAESYSESGGDFNRSLTSDGKKSARQIAKQIALTGTVKPDLLLTSPARRTMETAMIFAECFGLDPVSFPVQERALYDASSAQAMLKILRETDRSFLNVFVFGHNPAITDIAFALCDEFNSVFSPAAALGLGFDLDIWFELHSHSAEKLFYFYP